MECCKICGEMLDANGICPACYARMARERQQTEEPPAEAPKRTQTMPVQTKKRKPQNSLHRVQNSLGDTPPKQKRKTLLWIGIAAAVMLIGCVIVLAVVKNGTCGENVRWRFNILTGELTITGTGAMEDYQGSEPPWSNFDVKSVFIGDGVTTIGDDAFYDCDSLTSITIGDSVTAIGGYAFAWCDSLTSITIGDSVTSIGAYAFDSCDSLTSVTIGDSVTSIENNAFRDCYSLTDVYYKGTEEQWDAIEIDWGNEDLTNATIHYNS